MRLNKREYLEYVMKEDLPGDSDGPDMLKIIRKIERLKTIETQHDEFEFESQSQESEIEEPIQDNLKIDDDKLVTDEEIATIKKIYQQRTLSGLHTLGEAGLNYMVNIAKRLPFFKPFSNEIISELLTKASVSTLKQNTSIYKEDEIVNYMYVIIKGACSLFKILPRIDPQNAESDEVSVFSHYLDN